MDARGGPIIVTGPPRPYAAPISSQIPHLENKCCTRLHCMPGAGEFQMNQLRFTQVFRFASAIADACTFLVTALHKLISFDTRPYQPERFFMRGPGPAWRAKHAPDRKRSP